MLAGPGITKEVKLPETSEAAAYRFTITRLPAAGGNPAGTFDPTTTSRLFGTFLHVRVVLPSCGTNLVVGGDDNPMPPVWEWDPDGVEVFPPHCAQCVLIGGLGLYGVTVERVPMPSDGYLVKPRRLLRFLPARAATAIQVPSGHTGIGTLSGTAVVMDTDDGVPLNLSSAWSYAIPSGTTITSDPASILPVFIWTELKA